MSAPKPVHACRACQVGEVEDTGKPATIWRFRVGSENCAFWRFETRCRACGKVDSRFVALQPNER